MPQKQKSQTKKTSNTSKIVSLGAGAIALGAAAYYFLGPKGKKHQDSAKKWTTDAKKKIINEIKRSKVMSKAIYNQIVDSALMPYIEKSATATEVRALAQALKKDWGHISKVAKNSKAAVKISVSGNSKSKNK